MRNALIQWMAEFVWRRGAQRRVSNTHFLGHLEAALRLEPPLDTLYHGSVAADFEHRFTHGDEFAIDALDYTLTRLGQPSNATAGELERILSAGSVWQVAPNASGSYSLVRRDLEAAKDAITAIMGDHERAGTHLAAAWTSIATRDPNPDASYIETVKAIEAAAHAVICPDDKAATLGKMLKAMRDRPEKWSFALGSFTLVMDMCAQVWTNGIRHGTQDRANHTVAEADAALHLAIPLVRFFSGGLVVRVDGS